MAYDGAAYYITDGMEGFSHAYYVAAVDNGQQQYGVVNHVEALLDAAEAEGLISGGERAAIEYSARHKPEDKQLQFAAALEFVFFGPNSGLFDGMNPPVPALAVTPDLEAARQVLMGGEATWAEKFDGLMEVLVAAGYDDGNLNHVNKEVSYWLNAFFTQDQDITAGFDGGAAGGGGGVGGGGAGGLGIDAAAGLIDIPDIDLDDDDDNA